MASSELAERSVNVFTFMITAGICCFFVWAISLLPPRYYFQFSSVLAKDERHGTVMLAGPDLPLVEMFCKDVVDVNPAKYQGRSGLYQDCVLYRGDHGEIFIPAGAQFDGRRLYPAVMEDAVNVIGARFQAIASHLASSVNLQDRQAALVLGKFDGAAIDRGLREGTSSFGIEVEDELADAPPEPPAGRSRPSGSAPAAPAFDERPFGFVARVADAADSTEALKKRIFTALAADQKLRESLADYRQTYASAGTIGGDEMAALQAAYRARETEKLGRRIHDVMMERDKYNFVVAVALKLLPALSAGWIAALLLPATVLETAPVATAAVAFLYCWPIILLWDQVVSPEWSHERPWFLLMYFLYVVTYFWAGRLGALLGLKLGRRTVASLKGIEINWSDVATSAVTTAATSAATAALTWGVAYASR